MHIDIMMGLPGSGKTTWVNKTKRDGDEIVSADQYFTDSSGAYNFDHRRLVEAHQCCLRNYITILRSAEVRGYRTMFVDNTNTNVIELSPYVAIGEAYGHDVRVVVFHCDPKLAVARNTHGVSESTVMKMARQMEITLKYMPSRWKVMHVHPDPVLDMVMDAVKNLNVK